MKQPVQSYELPKTGYIRQRELLGIIPISGTTLWRRVKDGKFPPPVKLAERITAWRIEDIRAFMAAVQQAGENTPTPTARTVRLSSK